jgi:Ca-activated chloride channel homolog
VVDARRLLATELAELRAAVDAALPGELPEAQRCRLLADLGSRLHALVVYLTGQGIGDQQFGGLRTLGALAADLLRCDETDRPRGAALDRLWERTVRVLAEYAADGEATA